MTESLRCAFYGRVSTEDNQDPTLSLPRQLQNCEQALGRIGGEIVAHYFDVESGARILAGRGSGTHGIDVPIPRDGGLLDLLEEAPSGRFSVVVCESINRLSRNPSVTFRAEEDLRDHGVRLWAVDEPWEESFGSIVLRHVNVGLARGYLHELKVKSRQGIETAARQGRHAGGKSLYGYRFRELPHPNPHQASQGRRVKVLEPDPIQAPVVRMIFTDYVAGGLSLSAIREKLNADLDRYPPPESPDPRRRLGEWGRSSVWEILHNPKYTGYQVWNRRARKRGGKVNPPSAWVWSEEPAHDALVSREMFDQALLRAARNDNAARAAASHEAYRTRTYLLRSFVRCGLCGLRMHGKNRRGISYYVCDSLRRPAGLVPENHPPSVYLREDKGGQKVIAFLTERVFGPERAPLLREALAGTDPRADDHRAEAERLRTEVDGIALRIRRQVANLETEEPGAEVAREIRQRLEELAQLKGKREQQLEAAERAAAERQNPEQAAELLDVLPLLDVDFELLGDAEFRALLEALNFEARYDPRTKQLAVKVWLAPDLIGPNDGGSSSSLSLVPPAGLEPAHPAPEAGALSSELRGLACGGDEPRPAGPSLTTPLTCSFPCEPFAIVRRPWPSRPKPASSSPTTTPSSSASSRSTSASRGTTSRPPRTARSACRRPATCSPP